MLRNHSDERLALTLSSFGMALLADEEVLLAVDGAEECDNEEGR